MYGAEYETNTNSHSHVHGVDDTNVLCAVCYVKQRTAVYMILFAAYGISKYLISISIIILLWLTQKLCLQLALQ